MLRYPGVLLDDFIYSWNFTAEETKKIEDDFVIEVSTCIKYLILVTFIQSVIKSLFTNKKLVSDIDNNNLWKVMKQRFNSRIGKGWMRSKGTKKMQQTQMTSAQKDLLIFQHALLPPEKGKKYSSELLYA